jgi:hypothetical protein
VITDWTGEYSCYEAAESIVAVPAWEEAPPRPRSTCAVFVSVYICA